MTSTPSSHPRREPLRPRHGDYVADVIASVRRHGAGRAYRLLAGRPVPSARHRPHRTLDAYYVWAVDRLLTAGLEPWQVRWHPALHARSPLSWYDAPTLAGRPAHDDFVEPTIVGARDARPQRPRDLVLNGRRRRRGDGSDRARSTARTTRS